MDIFLAQNKHIQRKFPKFFTFQQIFWKSFYQWNIFILNFGHFFHRNSKHLGLGRQFGQIDFRAFGVFSANLSAPIFELWVLCPSFPLFNHYFYKKLSLHIQISNVFLRLGFDFGPQRIRDLAIIVRISSHLHVRQHDFLQLFNWVQFPGINIWY